MLKIQQSFISRMHIKYSWLAAYHPLAHVLATKPIATAKLLEISG